MPLKLLEPVRVEVSPEGSRAVTRVFVGERELPASPELRLAVARLCVGERDLPFALLQQAGVLVDVPADAPLEGPIALRANAMIGVRLRPGLAHVTSPRDGTRAVSVVPENTLAIGGFVPPAALGALQDLARVLRSAWQHMLSAAHSRGHLVDPDAARALLFEVAVQRIGEDPALALVLAAKDGRLVPRVPLQQDTFAYPLAELDLLDDRVPDRSTDRLRLRVGEGEGPALGVLFGALGSGTDPEGLRAVVDGRPAALPALRSLLASRMLGPLPARIAVPEGCVAHLGHATLLANLGGAHVLVDPWFPPASADDPSPPLSAAQLPALAGVFFTHHHWDHVNPGTLLRLGKGTPMFVPATGTGPLVPRTAALLREFGFTDVRELAHGQAVEIGRGGQVVAAPFTGEDPTGLGWIGNTLVLVHDGKGAWVHVDAGPDRQGRSLVSDGTAAALKARFGRLDPVFGTRRQERGTMVEHTWEFLLADPDGWARSTENCCNDAAFLGSLVAATGGALVLYSEGGAPWYPATTDFLRPGSGDVGVSADATDRVQTWLWDDLDAIRSACGGAATLSAPRDVWRIGGGRAEPLTW